MSIIKKSEVEGLLTVGIIEENGEINDFLCRLYKAEEDKNFCFSNNIENSYYDVIINNSGTSLKMPNCKFCLLNSDEKTNITFQKETTIISYGLNNLATATASSIMQDNETLNFQYCLQREFLSLCGKKIEPQEFPVKISHNGIKIPSALAVVTFRIMCNY